MTIPLPFRFDDQPLLWTVDGVYSPEECRDFIDFLDRADPRLATDNPIYRDQDRVIRDDPEVAEELFRRLRPRLPAALGPFTAIGVNERLRFYRYRPGQRFLPHMDHWYRPSEARVTLHTILVYFNDDFDGGETRFIEPLEALVAPRPGRAAIFQHKLRHEGAEVRRGVKYAMRTDLIFEAPAAIGDVTLGP
ncbi:MAG: 2OG-Fe(II) oxygenase [Nannocystaceae bacterium]